MVQRLGTLRPRDPHFLAEGIDPYHVPLSEGEKGTILAPGPCRRAWRGLDGARRGPCEAQAERPVHRRGRSEYAGGRLWRLVREDAEHRPPGGPWRAVRPRVLPVSRVQRL